VLLWNIIVLCYFGYLDIFIATKGPARPLTKGPARLSSVVPARLKSRRAGTTDDVPDRDCIFLLWKGEFSSYLFFPKKSSFRLSPVISLTHKHTHSLSLFLSLCLSLSLPLPLTLSSFLLRNTCNPCNTWRSSARLSFSFAYGLPPERKRYFVRSFPFQFLSNYSNIFISILLVCNFEYISTNSN